ncbi:uncharacterized protein TNCV_2955291 [Trichonephila clavipes]|nr:uncharacterized protein TNCV_2955291 [Trichonephila clavipes]
MPLALSNSPRPSEKFALKRVTVSQHIRSYFVVCQKFSDVTFDGTWLTRGHSSQIGVGCAIDLLTGFVMDFEIMSKRCIECEHGKSGFLGENSAEFNFWYEGYISSCAINHVGSPCGMKQEAALKLYQRSEDNGFQYTTLLSDGDAKTYQYLNTKEVYGPEIKIKKEECINHVSKRLGQCFSNWGA